MDHIPQKYPFSPISLKIPIFQYLNINKKEEKTSSLKPTVKVHHRIPARLWSLVERALFVGILENLSHIHPLRGGNRYHLQYTYQYAVFALSPAGTDLPLIVTISIIINKLTMINIATASRSDIIIIVRLLLLLLYPHK